MKKIIFGAQVFILIAAFPVLFITGISRPYPNKGKDVNTINNPASVNKSAGEANCICKITPQKGKNKTSQVFILNPLAGSL